jgi:Ca2+-binding EF-hand superfamily protein
MVEADDDIINCFKVFDTDKSGKCDSDELIHALTTLGEMSKTDAKQLVEDAGGKSSFDYSKFVKKMNKKAKGGGD